MSEHHAGLATRILQGLAASTMSVGAASSRNPFEDDSDGDEVNPLHGESPAKATQPWYAGL